MIAEASVVVADAPSAMTCMEYIFTVQYLKSPYPRLMTGV